MAQPFSSPCAGPLACKHVPTEQEVERAGYARDLGVSAMHKQDYRQALRELTRALELNPDDPEGKLWVEEQPCHLE